MRRKTLTSDQMQRLMREVVLDQLRSIITPEAFRFAEKIRREMEKKGMVPDWTLEFPD